MGTLHDGEGPDHNYEAIRLQRVLVALRVDCDQLRTALEAISHVAGNRGLTDFYRARKARELADAALAAVSQETPDHD